MAHKINFADWLAQTLGTRKWVLARRSPRLTERYEVFLSPKKYRQLEIDYEYATGYSPYGK